MKKTALLFVTIAIFAMLSGCQTSRTPLDAAGFTEKAEAAGYTVQDAADQFPEGAVNDCLLAIMGTDTVLYKIEFAVVPTVEQANSAYWENRSNIEASKGSASSNTSVSMDNYAYYKLTSDGKYSVISRIENTFVYVVASSEYKDEIAAFLQDIGY